MDDRDWWESIEASRGWRDARDRAASKEARANDAATATATATGTGTGTAMTTAMTTAAKVANARTTSAAKPMTKEEREAGTKGAILGNATIIKILGDDNQSQPAPARGLTPAGGPVSDAGDFDDDDMPF